MDTKKIEDLYRSVEDLAPQLQALISNRNMLKARCDYLASALLHWRAYFQNCNPASEEKGEEFCRAFACSQ